MGRARNGDGHPIVTRLIKAPPEVVWAVLADGWSYASWVVGISRIRDVDRVWPRLGSRIQHSVGVWPVLLGDVTEVLYVDPGRELLLRTRGWPAGAAQVRLVLMPEGFNATKVSHVEDAVAGPARWVPRPLRQRAIAARTNEALRRLGYLAEGRHAQDPS